MQSSSAAPSKPWNGTQVPDVPTEKDSGPDDERLISALRKCFDELGARSEDQTARIERAFETLRPKVPVIDNKTTFWNAYKTVADEYDKEFDHKYSTDLDTTFDLRWTFLCGQLRIHHLDSTRASAGSHRHDTCPLAPTHPQCKRNGIPRLRCYHNGPAPPLLSSLYNASFTAALHPPC
ncbi:hypothetical protein DFH06DRAFT_727143 [Mycena polygramma]|nr:hypothetical protein DFH06DRAFT_727143 [Mycena polygramma]